MIAGFKPDKLKTVWWTYFREFFKKKFGGIKAGCYWFMLGNVYKAVCRAENES